jgi:hypothetical protein
MRRERVAGGILDSISKMQQIPIAAWKIPRWWERNKGCRRKWCGRVWFGFGLEKVDVLLD